MTQSIDEALKSLHTAAIDALKGYEAARHDAEGKGMTPLFKEMIAIHTTNAAELAAAMRAHGEGFDDHGSVMSTVNKTIMDVIPTPAGCDSRGYARLGVSDSMG